MSNELDLELAKDGARVAWRSLVKFVAAGALAVYFGVRGLLCSEPPGDSPDFKYWGNHCGPGHGTDGDAVDDLDEACRKHDASY